MVSQLYWLHLTDCSDFASSGCMGKEEEVVKLLDAKTLLMQMPRVYLSPRAFGCDKTRLREFYATLRIHFCALRRVAINYANCEY